MPTLGPKVPIPRKPISIFLLSHDSPYADVSAVLGARPASPSSDHSPRKKRVQVRIACIHCQKACKKCSNTRPCDRCVKYGLKDCIDSTRKPRKTGVKRGPYKRRSSKYPDPMPSSSSMSSLPSSHTHTHHSDHPHNHQNDHPMDNAGYDLHSHTPLPPLQNQHFSPFSPSQSPVANYPGYPEQDHLNGNMGFPPPPRSALQGSMANFVSALSGPRWVNGQREHVPLSLNNGQMNTAHHEASEYGGDGAATPGVMYPSATQAFPLSLGGMGRRGGDPFSRAVSPIGTKTRPPLNINVGVGSGQSHFPNPNFNQGINTPPNEVDKNEAQSFPPVLDPLDVTNKDADGPRSAPPGMTFDGFQLSHTPESPLSPFGAQALSQPPSPKSNAWGVNANMRSSSQEPPSSRLPAVFGAHMGMNMGSFGDNPNYPTGYASPALVALKRIRKPSLKTLMSATSSQANSRDGSPMLTPVQEGDLESPTLFDQPMNDEMEGWLNGRHEEGIMQLDGQASARADREREGDREREAGEDLGFGGMMGMGFSA
ncbi:hypothetical protein TREMEDRAFT_59946 [Tremella mesenterica DSM 1558]|uniref:uncharacterized protein n=1 Tax=Tremella mesenterica (strain ATCC 24925 / CBS 8224 / DSM 1558 / NBRC 9311 / NRRL Y-6157 / RJB 2259-6 / UBC 559-6) TaxID=578456 RepID=UPI0003F49276|nr:uncharacterized protein TREMEDRAFT_59946 [Tremella mesenterica DSM 1558]EIW71003.1 hypothetical protein TREMEDRAFT_59946 [Tremella mesenterica DSM 1558]